MKKQTLLTTFICTLFLTAQAAVDAKRGLSAPNQMPLQTTPQLYVPNSLDLRLKENVQQQLRTSVRNFDPNRITVLSQNGEITLKGVVKTREEAAELEREVLRVTGVTQVRNNLVLSLAPQQ